ncbi:hypothetical protein VCJ_001209 [Vibrio metoecus]|nr:hypothetical protein VCJ_001209 [Vibrio metoecus]
MLLGAEQLNVSPSLSDELTYCGDSQYVMTKGAVEGKSGN